MKHKSSIGYNEKVLLPCFSHGIQYDVSGVRWDVEREPVLFLKFKF